ncbi:MAG TPA: hypothetical protein VG097_01515 [Gemmata sp.]|jgi:hypothetical protein|nr:hypothetical protein [Gemmata sp.]
MMLTILLIVGITITFFAVSAMTNKAFDISETASIGENTCVGLGDPSADTIVGHSDTSTSLKADWNLTTVSALCDAEDMLDYLEVKGHSERELLILGNSCFAVRWR